MWVIIYGFGPFVIAGIVGGGFAIYLVHNSRKAKHAKTVNSTSETRQETINKLLGGATIEDREKTGSKWKVPEQLQELAKAEKVDIFFKKDSMEMMVEKKRPKIRALAVELCTMKRSAIARTVVQFEKINRCITRIALSKFNGPVEGQWLDIGKIVKNFA